jgi:predicted DNA-binding ribbon-helix-helix protein
LASFLRVCCLRYLSAVAQKELDGYLKQAARVVATTGLRSVGYFRKNGKG